MTDIEIIDLVLKANKPSDIFNGDWKSTYTKYSSDVCKHPKAPLDLDMLKYAINCDRYHNKSNNEVLVMTCLDQVDSNIVPVTVNGEIETRKFGNIAEYCDIYTTLGSFSEEGYKPKN